MECELVRLAGVPIGLVTSALFYSTNTSGSSHEEIEGPSEQAREVLVAVCPTGRLLAFIASFKAQFVACNDPVQVPVAGEEGSGSITAYQTTYEGLLKVVRDPNTPRPIATAVVVMPVTLESRKEPSSVVLVGFSDGHIRAYSKKGVALFTQPLHMDPVVQIRCMAPSGDLHNSPSLYNVSVLVVFTSLVCVVEGWSLCEAVACAVEMRDMVMEEEEEDEREAPVISYRKWRLGDQRTTADAALLAPSLPSLYDYLCEAGNVGGYDTTVRGGPTPQAQLIVVGESPMISLYRISKDAGTVNVSEVVSAVASKMTRSVLGRLSQAGGWLGWGSGGGTPPSKAKPSQEKKMIMNLAMSTNIPDERRAVSSISVSPLGDLCACVDHFGRVLLLHSHSMTIRRMWKGYRDAQVGWILVKEPSSSSSAGSAALRRKRGRGSASSRPAAAGGVGEGERERKAQCLCLYLPHRGLLELWPVQNGGRIAVFQVGKGCRLLMAPGRIITASKSGKDEGDKSGWGKGCGLQDTAVLLCPNGHLLTILVPFPTLARLNDSSSHDTHLLQKLSPALQSGDCERLLVIISSLKTTQSLRDAVERVVHSYPVSGLPKHYVTTVLSSSLSRTSPTDPTHRAVMDYLVSVKQLLRLHLSLGQLVSARQPSPSPSPASSLSQMLADMCGLSGDAADEVARSLQSYAACKPAKLHTHVVRTLSLSDLLHCFDLPAKVGRGELHVSEVQEQEGVAGRDQEGVATEAGHEELSAGRVLLVLKRGIDKQSLSDLGFALLHVLLTQDVPERAVRNVLTESGIASATLLTLLSQVFLSGRVVPVGGDPRPLVLRVHSILHTITSTVVGEREAVTEALEEVRRQCSHTHNAGHALILILLCQKLALEWNQDERRLGEEGDWGDLGGGEEWETVTEEGEQWVSVQMRLEVLTTLCGAVGLAVVSSIPPLPLLGTSVEKQEEGRGGGGISVVQLEALGPWLIANCVARWLVEQKLPPKTVATLPALLSPSHTPTTGDEVAAKLGPLLRIFGRTLSSCSLLVHCAWQAAHLWITSPAKYPDFHEHILEFASLIPRPRILAGTCLHLWHSVFESHVMDTLDKLKRGSQQLPSAMEVVSLTRRLFTYLYQLGWEREREDKMEEEEEEEEVTTESDALLIPTPKDKKFLMDAALNLPLPPIALLRAYLSLLLHTELALTLGSTHNVAAFYPSSVRTVLKRGLLGWREGGRALDHSSAPPQLQHKRTKFLCESVTRYLNSPAPKLPPLIPISTINSTSAQATPTNLGLEVREVTGALFLLGELWGVEVDVVRRHLVTCLFAAGLGDRGTEAFQSVRDKSQAARDLLSLAGLLTDSLLQGMASKPERLALTAQLPPSQLEWVRKQSSSGVTAGCPTVAPTWASLSQLLSLIQPHLLTPSSSPSPSQLTASAAITQTLIKIASQQKQLYS